MSGASADDRIRWLHKRIADGSYPNAVRLSERFGISRRQATRDVEYMRRELGAPVKYDRVRRGFYYTSEFALPAAINVAQPDDYVELIAAMGDMTGGTVGADMTQMSIPYSAVLEIPDKLTVVRLGKLITGRAPVHRGAGEGKRYLCEFASVEAFLGALMAIGKPVRIVSPEWLRSRLMENIAALAGANNENVQNAQKSKEKI